MRRRYMTDEDKNEAPNNTGLSGKEQESGKIENTEDSIVGLKDSLSEEKNKYLRLYADFENYKKVSTRSREELMKYASEGLMKDILTVIDHLELSLQHSSDDNADLASLVEGVDLTLKELKNVLIKHGLTAISASGKPFDPSIHHALSQIETADADENTVVEEFRKGYMLKERVLRASLVGVAKKPAPSDKQNTE